MTVRLAEFIREEIEPILQNWEEFAKTLLHAQAMSETGLRDHARDMLMVIADDLDSSQSEFEQAAKSTGDGQGEDDETWAEVHGSERQNSGFSVMETISEFRALRASVVSLWTNAYPNSATDRPDDLTRFHEAIDQSVSESLQQYSTIKEMETRLFGAILVASPDPIFVLDLKGRIIYANTATSDLFALSPDQILGKTAFDLEFPFASDFQRNLGKVKKDHSIFRGQLTHTFPSGQGDRFDYLLAPVQNEYSDTEATVCIARDVTEQALAEEKTWHSAHHDLLTGLPNRRLFLDRLEQEVKHAKRSNRHLALLFMDLDGFKQVNDTLGHDVGDRLLHLVAERLTRCVREEDTVARLGGDEFTVILAGTEQPEDVGLVANTIIDALNKPFCIAQPAVQISASIGIAFFPLDETTPMALLEAADQAMYDAKRSGSNRMFFYEAGRRQARPSH